MFSVNSTLPLRRNKSMRSGPTKTIDPESNRYLNCFIVNLNETK